MDYKFNCFDGKVYSIFLCYGRSNGSVHHSIYDKDWNIHHECMTSIHHHNEIFPKPNSFEKMIEYSEILSKGFPFVRVDWYEIEGTPVFSEMTFTPGGGYFRNYTMEYLGEKTSFYLMNFDMATLPNKEQNLTENIEVIIHTVHPDFLIDLFNKMQKNRKGGNIAAVEGICLSFTGRIV